MKLSHTSSIAITALLLTAQAGLAQSQSELDALQNRVTALESEIAAAAATPPRFQFSAVENTTIELYGFVRFEAFYDFDFAQGDLTRAGRVGDADFATDGEFDTSVRVSRFGIRSNTDTDIGDISTQLEFDLFGSGGDNSSSPNLRLRHANININDQFLVGQTWTNFMPLVHYPSTADFNGPVGVTFARVPQARYTYNNGNGLQLSASIEEANGGGQDPVVTAAAFYDGGSYSVRGAVLASEFQDDLGNEFDSEAFTVSGSVQPWQGGTISATYVEGSGIGNLLIGGGERSVGGVVNDAEGYTVGITQAVSDKVTFGLNYGNESYDLATAVGTSGAFTDLETVFATVSYKPVDNLTLAVEYITISSEGPGFSADADRIGLSSTFSF